MGFVLPRNPNPLVTALGSLNAAVTKRATEGRENKLIGDAFMKLQDPNASALDQLSTIGQLDVSPEKKEYLSQGLQIINKQKAEAAEKQRKEIKDKIDLERTQASNIQLATNLNLPNPESFKDTPPAQIVASAKQLNPTSNPNGTTKPIPPDQIKKMNEIDAANPGAKPSKKVQLYQEAGIPQSSYEFRIESEQEENKPSAREEEIGKKQAQEDVDYYNRLQERAKKSEVKAESLLKAEEVIKKGVSGKAYEQVLESLGLYGKTSEGRRELAALIKNQYTDFKEIAGSQLTGMEFQTLAQAYPNANFSEAANLAIVKNLKITSDTIRKEREIAEKLIKDNGGQVPEYFSSKVNTELFKYLADSKAELRKNAQVIMNDYYHVPEGKVLMFVKGDTNQPLYVNPDEIDKYEKLGAQQP